MTRARTSLILLTLVLMASTAVADLSWSAKVGPPEPTAGQANPPPSIHVQVVGAPLPALDAWRAFRLRHDPADQPRRGGATPVRAIPYHQSTETLGLVVLIEGHEYYFGNDTYKLGQDCEGAASAARQEPCRIVKASAGVYAAVRRALEAPGTKDTEIPSTVSRAGPAGSKGALIVYSAGAVKTFAGELQHLTADKLGDQRAQEARTSRDLVAGLRLAAEVLAGIGTDRKALFIVSDGYAAGDGTEVEALADQLRAGGVEVFGFDLDATSDFIPDDAATRQRSRATLARLADGKVVHAADPDALYAGLTAAVVAINSRYTLVFPGQSIDPGSKQPAGFVWDGREHRLLLSQGDEPIINHRGAGDTHPVVLTLAPAWGGAGSPRRGWLWLALPGGLLLLALGAVALRRKAPTAAGA